MAKSNLLKEAIADAKAVRETAIANAKIALEEAFTPRLQSILSQKLQQEIEGEEEEDDFIEEEYGAEDAPTCDSDSIGAGKGGTQSGTSGKQPSGIATKPHTELGDTDKESSAIGSELEASTVVKEGEEDENGDGVIDDPTGASVMENEFESDEKGFEFDGEEDDDDELDLESIIRELEGELEDGDEEFGEEESEEEFGGDIEAGEVEAGDESGEDFGGGESEEEFGGEEDDIDLDEILREMGYGEEEEESEEPISSEAPTWDDEKEAELEEAYRAVRTLQSTINEVNLLNAKLLYSNKLFRSYELTNEQKMKVVETLDRSANVREVKLVFATLAESLKVVNTTSKRKKKITENFASNVVKSTAPKKEILAESNGMAERFKQLANIKSNKLNG